MKQIDNSEPLRAPGSAKSYMIQWGNDGGEKPAYPSDMLRVFLNRAPVKTMADSLHALRILDLIEPGEDDVTPDVLKVEDADHAWLLKAVEEAGPAAVGIIASRLKDALQPMSVSDKRAAKKKTEPETE